MPAQKRSQEASPAQPPPLPADEEKDENPELNQNREDEQDDESDDSDGSASYEDDEQDEYITVRLGEIRKEVQCPICLGIIRKTRTVMECLHRFCRECIDKSMRLGNNECPACRTHCASRRSLRDDPNYDALIALLYPDIDKYEEEELAFHEEEKARNKQIQASIAQTMRRQSEALGRKRTPRTSASAYARRSQSNYRNLRGRRNNRASEIQMSDEEDANGNDGSKDSSSADERSPEVKPKRGKRWGGRFSQSSAGASADAGCDENDLEVNRESLGASAGLVGSSEILAWGRGGIRSHTRHARNSRISKLIDHLQSSEANFETNYENLDVSLTLVSLNEEEMPSLQRPCLSCEPTVAVGKLCTYVAMWTSMNAEEIDMFVIKEPQPAQSSSSSEVESITKPVVADLREDDLHLLKEDQTLGEIRATCNFDHRNLVLGYRRKSEASKQ